MSWVLSPVVSAFIQFIVPAGWAGARKGARELGIGNDGEPNGKTPGNFSSGCYHFSIVDWSGLVVPTSLLGGSREASAL